MNRHTGKIAALSLGLTLCAPAGAADAGGADRVYTGVSESGTVEIGNVPPDGAAATFYEGVPAAPPAAPAATAKRQPAPVMDDQTRAVFQQYRDKMNQAEERTTAANPAVNRRYRMIDRETYRATLGAPTTDAQGQGK